MVEDAELLETAAALLGSSRFPSLVPAQRQMTGLTQLFATLGAILERKCNGIKEHDGVSLV